MSLINLPASEKQKLKDLLSSWENPYELLNFVDDAVNKSTAEVYEWQKQKLIEFGSSLVKGRPICDTNPYMGIVRAANGSGKSKYILAPCVLWMLFKENALAITTTASGAQLDTQDERYTRLYAQKLNTVFYPRLGEDLLKINKRHFECPLFSSFADFFATDEPNKAEGKHPLAPGAEFAIFIDEAKSIPYDIYEALDRCNGYTRRLEISSPGDQSGYFYDINTHKDSPYSITVVTYKDCKHISEQDAQWKIKKYGLSHPLIRSSLFAEFTSISDNVVIPRNILNKCKLMFNEVTGVKLFGKKRVGLDLSAGGDEIVASLWQGNKQLDQKTAVIQDTVLSSYEIINWFKDWELDPEEDSQMIFGDDGGVGHGIIDNLWHAGWKINRMYNQSRAIDNNYYANRGCELWFNFKRFVEEKQLIWLDDQKLEDQLVNRHYKRQLNNKLILEAKAEAKANGHPSPDRADAAILAWTPFMYPCIDIEGKINTEVEVNPKFKSGDDFAAKFYRDIHDKLLKHQTATSNVNEDKGVYKTIDKFGLNSVGQFLASKRTQDKKLGKFRLN